MCVFLLILSFCCCENVPHWPSVYLLCTSCMRRWLVMRCAKQQQQGKAVSWSRRRRSRGVPSRQPCPAHGGGAGGVCSSASIAIAAGSSSISRPLFPDSVHHNLVNCYCYCDHNLVNMHMWWWSSRHHNLVNCYCDHLSFRWTMPQYVFCKVQWLLSFDYLQLVCPCWFIVRSKKPWIVFTYIANTFILFCFVLCSLVIPD